MTDCPHDDTLRGYLDDSLPPDLAGPVTGHIDQCPDCQRRLDQLTSGSDAVGRLKAAALAESPAHPTASTHDTYLFGDSGHGVGPLPTVARSVLPSVPGYDIQEEIGRGGMGVVYKALHRRLNRPAAVKMVLAGGLADPRVTQRFLFEAEILGRVRHPQVVQVYEVSLYAAPTGVSIPFLAMEYLDGGTLADWSGGTPQPPRVAAELIAGLARAVHAAHAQGIVHRDLKPANILRAADGTFKVTDFGLAKLTAETSGGLTGTGTVLGTPAYMAPEQAAGEKGIGPPADVYSLGAILFELLTGRPPFAGAEPMSVLLKVINSHPPDVRSLRREVPRDLAAIAAKCLKKEPHRRYGSAAELADDLARFGDGRPTRARTHGTAERLWYWSRRNPGVAAMLAALVVVLVTAFVSVMVLWRRAEGNAAAMTDARDVARRQFDEAETQRDEAARQRRLADTQAAHLAFDQAVVRCESGQIDDGLRGFVRALELAERSGEADLARVIRSNLAGWERELFPAGTVFRHGAPVLESVFSPDGAWVVTAGTDRRVVVRDAETGRRLFALDVPLKSLLKRLYPLAPVDSLDLDGVGKLFELPSVNRLAVSRDRRRLVAQVSSGQILVWTLADGVVTPPVIFHPELPPPRGKPVTSKPQLAAHVWSIAFDKDSALWVGGDEGLLACYDVSSDPPVRLHTPRLPESRQGDHPSVQVIRSTAAGTLLVGDRDGRLLEYKSLQTLPTLRNSTEGWVTDIDQTTAEDVTALTGTFRSTLSGGPTDRWELPSTGEYFNGARFVGDRLVVATAGGFARAWDRAGRVSVGGPLRVSGRIAARPGRPDVLLPVGEAVRLQPVPVPATTFFTAENRAITRVLQFSPDGSRLLVGAGALTVHDTRTGRPTTTVLDGGRWSEALGGRFFAGGTRVLYGLRNGWGAFDLTANTDLGRRRVDRYVNEFPAAPDDDAPHVWDSGTLQSLGSTGLASERTLNLRQYRSGSVLLAPGGREIRVALGATVHLLAAETGDALRSPIRLPDEFDALGQTPDGTALLVGLRDNTLQLIDAASGTPRFAHRPRHELGITALATSPDGTVILSGSRDKSARFWDAKTGLVLGPKLRHAGAVAAVAYSPKGDCVATGTVEGRVVGWPVPPPPATEDVATLRERYAAIVGNARPPAVTYE